MSVRDEFLRLLREDEVFRLAVLGYLGISDVQSSVRELVNVVNDLARNQLSMINTLNKVISIMQKLTEEQDETLSNIKKLWEENNKIWLELRALREDGEKRWGEAYRRFEVIENELKVLREDSERRWIENDKKWQETYKRFETIENELKALRESTQRHEQELKALRESSQRHEEELKALREGQEKLWEENHKLWEENNKIWREIRNLRRDVAGVSHTVGVLVERDVRHYLPGWIRERFGVSIDRLRRLKVEGVVEIDGYAEVDNKVIAVEVKATLRVRDINDFMSRINRLRAIKPGKEVIAVIAYVNEAKDTGKAIELAKQGGVKVVRHHGEYEFEELT